MMVRYTINAALILAAVAHLPEAATAELPTAHYRQVSDDPDWLVYAAQFHGHLGPWAMAGMRVGVAGRQAVGAKGYFDVDVTVTGPFVKPPKSCFLDGLQVSTGATWGKRNIRWVEGDEIVVRIRNTRSGKIVEVRPTLTLSRLLESMKVNPKEGRRDDHSLEKLARKIAVLPEPKLVLISSSRDEVEKVSQTVSISGS